MGIPAAAAAAIVLGSSAARTGDVPAERTVHGSLDDRSARSSTAAATGERQTLAVQTIRMWRPDGTDGSATGSQ